VLFWFRLLSLPLLVGAFPELERAMPLPFLDNITPFPAHVALLARRLPQLGVERECSVVQMVAAVVPLRSRAVAVLMQRLVCLQVCLYLACGRGGASEPYGMAEQAPLGVHTDFSKPAGRHVSLHAHISAFTSCRCMCGTTAHFQLQHCCRDDVTAARRQPAACLQPPVSRSI
jgi:hypothetical protein